MRLKFLRWLLTIFSCLMLGSCGLKQNVEQSQAAAEEFLQHLKAHQYVAALQLISTESTTMKGPQAITAQVLQTSWQGLEQKNGPVKSWAPESFHTQGNKRRYTDLEYRVKFSKEVGTVRLRTCFEDGKCRILNLSFY